MIVYSLKPLVEPERKLHVDMHNGTRWAHTLIINPPSIYTYAWREVYNTPTLVGRRLIVRAMHHAGDRNMR